MDQLFLEAFSSLPHGIAINMVISEIKNALILKERFFFKRSIYSG
jgi:hypothetical protein